MPSQGLFTALAGFGRGLVDEAEARRVREERARLQAAAELKDRLAQERQSRLDQQALQQQGVENARADAATALSMNKGGFSPWQAGTVNGEEAATAQAWPTAPATGGMAGSVLGAVAPVAQKMTLDQGLARAKQLAGAQGGYVKTGVSETERVREDDRAAKAEALQASLAQARELAQQRIDATAAEKAKDRENQRFLRSLVAGAGQPKPGRAVPASTIKDYQGISANIREIEDALATAERNPAAFAEALGLKNMLPEWIATRGMSKDALTARGKLSNLASGIFLERSGAAVTPSEAKRLEGWTANLTDNPAKAKNALQNILAFYRQKAADMEEAYGPEAGYRELPGGSRGAPVTGGSDSPSPTTVTPRLPGESIAAYRKRTGG